MKIVVNTFYVSSSARASFEEIARRTGGVCTYLDVNKSNSQEILLNLFVPNILKMIGEATGDTKLGSKMVEDYMRCYKSWVIMFLYKSKNYVFLSCIQI